MESNKNPGSDGLPDEFYTVFWNDINQYLLFALKLISSPYCSLSRVYEFSAGIPVISNARIFSLVLLHVLACGNYALIVIG